MFEVRSDEPKYAFLWDKETRQKNRYGQDIELTQDDDSLRNVSLNINDDCGIGENPNRYKQHGFYFNADNCIGCHACEAACSEKNDNPAHISFRSVGYVEGGTYPDYQRLNISMACNHCDDPVCLKGCPTRAYTKFAEYGAVLQDPDICFGCGYCTWVCPYNAPQLDPVAGEVSKCNMCVDRLEVGLKPSCVSACLGNALEFGVIENIPENRVEAKAEIPGFPTTDITQPNIRFQQTVPTHREMTRTDGMPLKYHRDDEAGIFKPELDAKHGQAKHWNWKKLLTSHESAHVIFTLSAQAVLGAFLLLVLSSILGLEALSAVKESALFSPVLVVMFVVLTIGLFKLNMHLGKPHRFYRGFNNLKHSPLSREIAGVSAFYTFFMGYVALSFFDHGFMQILASICAVLGSISGALGVYYMVKLYQIKARPFWNHWQTATSFYGSLFSLGGVLLGLLTIPFTDSALLIRTLASVTFIGLAAEIIGHIFHTSDMRKTSSEGVASWYIQNTRFGKSWILRNVLLGSALAITLATILTAPEHLIASYLWVGLFLIITSAAAISRSLFFVTVIPTTMPGAFFWKNKQFSEHALETGLAEMEQVGVEQEVHHPFKFDELLETIKTTPLKEMIRQTKDIIFFK
ncbi:MAG: aspartate carbamoyltransferase [Cycloclasticus sp. symbiont of Bathymodiolus heckerae]|nr:MAG: aspartate carbamoyltransferase [Cycloclasticus sp. symbiont of Bathymodiolus heckerae]